MQEPLPKEQGRRLQTLARGYPIRAKRRYRFHPLKIEPMNLVDERLHVLTFGGDAEAAANAQSFLPANHLANLLVAEKMAFVFIYAARRPSDC